MTKKSVPVDAGVEKVEEVTPVVTEVSKPAAPAAAAVRLCACGCGKPLPADAKAHWTLHPDCFEAQRGLKQGGKRKRRWTPNQRTVEQHLERVLGIFNSIKARSTDRRSGKLRYDFAAADELFERAKVLYAEGKFGWVEVAEREYDNLLDFLYQGVLAEANRIVAEGKLADARQLLEEGGLARDLIKEAEVEVAYLLHEGKTQKAADKAGEALKTVLDARRTAGRKDFLAQLERRQLTISDIIGPEAERKVRAAAVDRRGRGVKKDKDRERRPRKSESPAHRDRRRAKVDIEGQMEAD